MGFHAPSMCKDAPATSYKDGSARIHLITILYKSEDQLPAFLHSLTAQDMSEWRLYAIDNASPDESASLIRQAADPRISLLCNSRNLGFAKAANQGLRAAIQAGGDLLVLINNDTEFEADFLRRFLDAWNELGAQAVAPRVMRRDQPEKCWYAGGSLNDDWVFTNVHHDYDPGADQAPARVDFAPGCCLGLTRAVLRRVGLLDESFFVYWEDTDFCIRLKASGIPLIYLPEPSLRHSAGAASGGELSLAYIRLYYRSYIQLLRKHFGLGNAVATMLRLLRKEYGQPERDRARTRAMLSAMLRGLAAPLTRQPHLDEHVSRET